MKRRDLALLGVLALVACSKAPEEAGPPSGERLFSQCAVCHVAASPETPAGRMKLVGPSLWGVYGRSSASVEGFKYSRAMTAANLVWDEATLAVFLENPQKAVPGTNMSFAGEKDAARRAAIIEYLKTLK
jgi:cytochrome c